MTIQLSSSYEFDNVSQTRSSVVADNTCTNTMIDQASQFLYEGPPILRGGGAYSL